jgi:hypothetical protein
MAGFSQQSAWDMWVTQKAFSFVEIGGEGEKTGERRD